MRILGVDEAGRGPVIGSMFVASFEIDGDRINELEEIGVKDSKKLSNKKREEIREQLDSIGDFTLKEIEASQIDEMREVMTLNEIELQAFVEVLKDSDADRFTVDLPEPDGDRFIKKMKSELPEKFRDKEFVAEHGADDEYPEVSAASIVAKSAREKHVEKLQQKYGYDFGSGYPHDRPTIEFLEKFMEEKGELPEETRMSWSTAEKIVDKNRQKSFEEY
ncbi:MAG: ribonuclease HII [Candidatus Nanohaloarchaea archaeon]